MIVAPVPRYYLRVASLDGDSGVGHLSPTL